MSFDAGVSAVTVDSTVYSVRFKGLSSFETTRPGCKTEVRYSDWRTSRQFLLVDRDLNRNLSLRLGPIARVTRSVPLLRCWPQVEPVFARFHLSLGGVCHERKYKVQESTLACAKMSDFRGKPQASSSHERRHQMRNQMSYFTCYPLLRFHPGDAIFLLKLSCSSLCD